MLGALRASTARAFQHGRLWINDPDCLIVRPEISRRKEWADYLLGSSWLSMSGDRLSGLDETGVELTRAALRRSSPVPDDRPIGVLRDAPEELV